MLSCSRLAVAPTASPYPRLKGYVPLIGFGWSPAPCSAHPAAFHFIRLPYLHLLGVLLGLHLFSSLSEIFPVGPVSAPLAQLAYLTVYSTMYSLLMVFNLNLESGSPFVRSRSSFLQFPDPSLTPSCAFTSTNSPRLSCGTLNEFGRRPDNDIIGKRLPAL